MNYLEPLKKVIDPKKKETLIYLLVCFVILFIAITYIFSEDSDEKEVIEVMNKEDIVTDEMEKKLSNILSEIEGISDVSVMITYEYGTVTTPIFNISEDIDEDSKSLDKEVVYNEEGNNKEALIESIEMPKVKGAIIVAKGADNAYMKSKIQIAVSNLTNVASYKVEVFEKKGE